MVARRQLKTLVCIHDASTRNRLLQLLRALQADAEPPLQRYDLEVQECTSPAATLQALQAHYAAAPTGVAMLISDELAESTGLFPDVKVLPTQWAKEMLDELEGRLLVTIAVMDRFRRVPDIDRVLWHAFDRNGLLEVLRLAADKLTFITPPERTIATARRDPVMVRPISRQEELQAYFQLRHRVYRIMGYLDERVELAASGMEIDSGDTHALHVGAFVKDGASERLVGTARVVSLEPLDNRYGKWTRALAASDAVLRTSVARYDPLRLPIFQSMSQMNAKMSEVLTKDGNCGELSRVIVTEDYRGRGLSTMLVWFALLQAINKGVNQLLLECLPIHEALYRKFGFQPLADVKGRVIGVNKTMIAMELDSDAIEHLRNQPSVTRFFQAIQAQGWLQTCNTDPCGRAECERYTNGCCPPI